MANKRNFLARGLLDAIEDENFFNVQILILKYAANPNLIPSETDIAPIHYITGMENVEFARKALSLILNNGGDPNVPTKSGETPLHIASMSGRIDFVKMLLDKGGDIDAKDENNYTPLVYAVKEKHFELVQFYQQYLLEKKHKERLNSLQTSEDVIKLTPNGRSYNLDPTSPYYINITHRKTRKNKELQKSPSTTEKSPNKTYVKRNLFELTEKNLSEFDQETSTTPNGKSRRSIDSWRSKIQLKNCHSLLKGVSDIEDYMQQIAEQEHYDALTSTRLSEIENDPFQNMESTDEFLTASVNNDSYILKSPKLKSEFVYHMTEDYMLTDDESGVTFIERKIFAEPAGSAVEPSENDVVLNEEALNYDTDDLRRELTQFGDNPGPIMKTTKRLYMKRLIRYKCNPEMVSQQQDKSNDRTYSIELQRTLHQDKWQQTLVNYLPLEAKMVKDFKETKVRLREGNLKTSFIYLLIDPRISDNLPGSSKLLSPLDSWKRFLHSIIYVGKGKGSRPYSHLYDAIKLFERNSGYNPAKSLKEPKNCSLESKKLNRIIDIWNSGNGIVCLHVFHNILPVEAYTREAAIIDSLGLPNLTNLKRGDYYGAPQAWTLRTRKQLGALMLYKAYKIFLAEGETQLRPCDIKEN